jgi:large subunit ribosomal protein L9
MKVILLKDIPKIGKKYDIKDVPDGYANNFLLPKKLVEMATPKKLKEIEEINKTIQIEKQIQDDLLMKNLAQLDGLELIMKCKTSAAGHLFKAIHKEDIVEKMRKDYQIHISPDCIILDKPIKTNGDYIISVQVKDKKTSFKLIIEKE